MDDGADQLGIEHRNYRIARNQRPEWNQYQQPFGHNGL